MSLPNNYLEDHLEPLKKRIAELDDDKVRIVRGQFAQICSACGYEVKAGESSWETLQVHIDACTKHPVFKLKAELAAAREALEKITRPESAYKMQRIAQQALRDTGKDS